MIGPMSSRRVHVAATLIVLALAGPAAALGHSPDPQLGSSVWNQDQVVPWAYRTGQVPPAWMTAAIEAAAAGSNATRASRAATFAKVSSSNSRIAYGEPTGCSSLGIACFSRSAPTLFSMWFRANGWIFDWGRLSWCQGPGGFVNGCFDVENVALDEFGHVLGLGHHVNLPNQSDYLDAVVQTASRARPAAGWNAHVYGRCDTARLQLIYDRPTASSPFSTCLAIPTATTISSSATSIWLGDGVRFTATLKTTTSSANKALAGDAIAGRTVILQRRVPGTTTWTSIAAMPATSLGIYELVVSPTVTNDWRASFTPTGEGLLASSSTVVQVSVGGCSRSPCSMRVQGSPSLGIQ